MVIRMERLDEGMAVVIPEPFASELGLEPNSQVNLSLCGSAIMIRRARNRQSELEAMLARVTDENIHGEIDTGDAVGRELW